MKHSIQEFIDENGKSEFSKWFNDLDSRAAAKVTIAIHRLESGNHSNVKSLGSGVSEYKIDFGPGYRVYFAKDGETLIILLAGGTKKGQQKDIDKAKSLWQLYKKLKRER